MAGKGGARPGSGRKPKQDKHATAINRAEKQIKDQLPEIVSKQLYLAMGGFEQVNETWEPAGLITIKQTGYDAMGKSVVEEVLAFPSKPPEELVLVRKAISVAAPDRSAGQYLINRIMGTPVQRTKDEDTENKMSFYGQLVQDLWAERGMTTGSNDHQTSEIASGYIDYDQSADQQQGEDSDSDEGDASKQ